VMPVSWFWHSAAATPWGTTTAIAIHPKTAKGRSIFTGSFDGICHSLFLIL
jgi:hypothetical protein